MRIFYNNFSSNKRIFSVISLILVFLSVYVSCLADDWKALHEKADNLNLEQAQAAAGQNVSSNDDQYILGLVYLNLHKDKEANTVFLRLLRTDPDSLRFRWALAETLRREHKLDAAEKTCEEIIKAAPDFSPAYLTLAFIKFLKTDYSAAIKLSTEVIRQGRDNVDLSNYARAYSLLAGANGMLAHYGGIISKAVHGPQVMPNLIRAQKLQPQSPGVLFGLGSYYLLAPALIGRDLKKSQDYLKETIRVDPLFADAYVRLAQVYKAKGQVKEYESYLAQALKVDPENELALDIKSGKCRFICVD